MRSPNRPLVPLATTLALAVLAVGAAAASAHRRQRPDHHSDDTAARLLTLEPDPAGNPEGITFNEATGAFYVATVGDGAIYRGTLGGDTVSPFIPGGPGESSVGIHERRGLLYVAGGASGKIKVFDIETRRMVASFETGAGGFLNDLVVTDDGNVYVTDSFRPTLWHVTPEQVATGAGVPQALDVASIPLEPGVFNLNGIVATDHRTLIAVHSPTGRLFRISLNDAGDVIEHIDSVSGVSVPAGDGMLLDRGRLVVVQAGPPARLTLVELADDARRGEVRGTIPSPLLNGPSTVDRAGDLYLVVNADFATSTPPFTVAAVPAAGGDQRPQ